MASRDSTQVFQINLRRDLPTMADILLGGQPGGWVAMAGNLHGRKCVEAVFPDVPIAWRDCAELADWCKSTLNLPDVANVSRHKLPGELTSTDRFTDLSKCTPDELAFLLAMAAREQGARVALYREGEFGIFLPTAGASALQ